MAYGKDIRRTEAGIARTVHADLPPSAPLRFIHGSQLQGTVALVLLRCCRSTLSWLS